MSIATLLTLALLAVPFAAEAQSKPGNSPRIGWLSDGVRSNSAELQDAFVQGLRDLGYVEGRNVVIERRDADARMDRLPALAAELVKLRVDVIVTAGGGVPATNAAKRATRSIPIVMTESGDPVATGLVASLARPGGNVTGLSVGGDLPEKRLQLLKEIAPAVSRVAAVYNPTFPAGLLWVKQAQAAAPALRLTIVPLEARTPEELDKAFALAIKSGADALLTFGDPFASNRKSQIMAFVSKHRLPSVHTSREFVEADGLVSYGANLSMMYRRAALYVDRVLKGAKPAELPIEQPTKLELVINAKTAKALGLTIPASMRVNADQVIEQ